MEASAPVTTSTASVSVIVVDDGPETVILTVFRISFVSAAADAIR